MYTIAIIDAVGLSYDGETLSKRGLGGSESAVIYMSAELVKLGYDVTVYNNCESPYSSPGVYNGVSFKPLREVENPEYYEYDIVIGFRSVAAFVPHEERDSLNAFAHLPDFSPIVDAALHKILWMQDTFCHGDHLIEQYLNDGVIDEVFTLSDWHSSYVSHADHGKKRMSENFHQKIFQTRNGIKKHIDWVDIKDKDPNLFVYNASVSKGMAPLVEKVWPIVHKAIPQARLKIIGGYYRFNDCDMPDMFEQNYLRLKALCGDSIEFTGIIKQSEIANILAKAAYTIFPCADPETFGISTLESIYYNTPVFTCEFAALEETAIDSASYKIRYPVTPNWMVPWIDQDAQAQLFADMVIRAYNTPYLHQQKQYACNAVADICEWDTVALQWHQHFCFTFGKPMSKALLNKVNRINQRAHKVFGRRTLNKCELGTIA